MYELTRHPTLNEPILLLGLESWIDAGFGGVSAVSEVFEQTDTQVIGEFDMDALLDYRSRRPTEHIINGVTTEISWPELIIRAGQDDLGNDLLIVAGPEPDMRWHSFSTAVAELASDFGVRLAIAMGAFPAPVPHTRPVRLAASATTEELARAVGFINATVDVPAGVHAILQHALREVGIDSVGIWARVPHYVAGMPYPAASAALINAFAALADLSLTAGDLEEQAQATMERIDTLITNSDEHRALVTQLEQQVDAEDAASFPSDGDLPTGDEIAAELERFLRGETQ